jgi:tartrate dehydrogenase/decarboxylase / D-malate dehydrogenase
VAIMLEHLGEIEVANALEAVINKTTSQGILTTDVGGSSTTNGVAQAISSNL